jgi:hypothetical protein
MVKGKAKHTTPVSDEKNRIEEMAGVEKAGAGDSRAVVVMDRRRGGDRRSGQDRRSRQEPILVERRKLERRAKVPRRRQIDPTTCERDYTPEEIEFMRALDEYKRSSGRMFPTCSEILEVLRKLGYEKRSPTVQAPPPETGHCQPPCETKSETTPGTAE